MSLCSGVSFDAGVINGHVCFLSQSSSVLTQDLARLNSVKRLFPMILLCLLWNQAKHRSTSKIRPSSRKAGQDDKAQLSTSQTVL
ncbi:hypothetical protein XFF6992_270004 [Xanthomonas citri pv. fuscans]|nr:hypothetical protein XFF6992_270004 [Xanthomonas citri pv. fuscans]